jgi:TonB family protein
VIQPRAAMLKMSAVLIATAASGLIAAQDSKPLPAPSSPGKAIQDAAQASAHDQTQDPPKRGAVVTLYGAEGKSGNVEILTDTQGVNFGPYLKDALATVRKNWYALIPSDAKTKKGKLAVEFAIKQDGHIAGLKLVSVSGDEALDRAAWGGITASDPFPALPSAFTGSYLALRFRFYYNPSTSDLDQEPGSRAIGASVAHAVLMQETADSNVPKYPKKALKDKIEGIVRIEAQIAPDGTVQSAAAVEGNLVLGDAASQAIRKWRFQPAQINGKPAEDRVRIRVEFRLDGARVRAEVVWPEPAHPVVS